MGELKIFLMIAGVFAVSYVLITIIDKMFSREDKERRLIISFFLMTPLTVGFGGVFLFSYLLLIIVYVIYSYFAWKDNKKASYIKGLILTQFKANFNLNDVTISKEDEKAPRYHLYALNKEGKRCGDAYFEPAHNTVVVAKISAITGRWEVAYEKPQENK